MAKNEKAFFHERNISGLIVTVKMSTTVPLYQRFII